MYDNARPHGARIVTEHKEQEAIDTIFGLAMSPEMNPIENFWDARNLNHSDSPDWKNNENEPQSQLLHLMGVQELSGKNNENEPQSQLLHLMGVQELSDKQNEKHNEAQFPLIIYRIKVEEQLNDSTFYSEIPDNIDHLVKRRMNTVLNKYTTATTEKEYDYLKNFERKTSNFYGLPKIHKSKEIQSAINSQQNEYIKVQKPTDLKLRPIIAGPASPTHRLSNFLDIILKPLCKYVPSYIRDDIDFLSHLPKIAPVHARLVSFDVTSLYTNIPHDLGIEAIQYWVAKHRDAIPNRFTVDFILDSTKLILENNSFYFNGKNYLQHRGTAMGTKFAPTYATLVMGFLEQRLYQEVENNFGVEFAREFELSWKRYLDDCFIIWNKSDEELQLFSDILNNLHTSIKFTKDENFNQLPFLDILVIKDGTEIKTDIFYKGTDTHQYLDFNSCHPSHTKRNIPYCLARKICTVVEDEHLREDRLEELQSFLIKQNYPETLIERGIQMAKQIPTNQLRSTCEEQSNNNDKI
ncbi:uncharacterized protein [Mytilus edulis]|uniref:uncharacterized protein n=1 Tax=Mytilus edulis TaxID=6550 RepID=UPI0039EE0F0C